MVVIKGLTFNSDDLDSVRMFIRQGKKNIYVLVPSTVNIFCL
jgi:hypothetical protein